LAGSSVGAMVVGTVFIMVFGMATVSLVESVNESIDNSEHKLDNPEVILVSVTDKVESTGPVSSLAIFDAGTGYTAETCSVSGATGTALEFNITVDGTGAVTGVTVEVIGTGYTNNAVRDLDCPSGGSDGQVTITVHEKNIITIKNVGSDNVRLSHVVITLSETTPGNVQGKPFLFTNHYSGTNLYLFPGEELSSDAFTLDSTTHGFDIGDDPDRAFLAIYEHNDAMSVTIT